MSRARNLRRLRPLEWDEQCTVVEWADLYVVEYARDRFGPLGRFLYAVPNGEAINSGHFTDKQRAARIGRLRRGGFRKGALDLCLDLPRARFHGARLEMKSAGNRPSVDQAEWMRSLLEVGYHVGWADNSADAILWLKAYADLGLFDAGRPSGAAPGLHRPEIAGSNPAPATIPETQEASHD